MLRCELLLKVGSNTFPLLLLDSGAEEGHRLMEVFVHELADVDASRVVDWLPLFVFLLDLLAAIILILTLIVKWTERVCIIFIIVVKIFQIWRRGRAAIRLGVKVLTGVVKIHVPKPLKRLNAPVFHARRLRVLLRSLIKSALDSTRIACLGSTLVYKHFSFLGRIEQAYLLLQLLLFASSLFLCEQILRIVLFLCSPCSIALSLYFTQESQLALVEGVDFLSRGLVDRILLLLVTLRVLGCWHLRGWGWDRYAGGLQHRLFISGGSNVILLVIVAFERADHSRFKFCVAEQQEDQR